MPHHVKIVAVLVARPGKGGELRVLLDGMVAPSREEPGNLRYDLWRDRADPDRFVLDELYADDGAVPRIARRRISRTTRRPSATSRSVPPWCLIPPRSPDPTTPHRERPPWRA